MAERASILGLHHMTAIAGNPVRNIAFYRDILGLRFIKKTVNYDDPGTWHLYYGDYRGTPGTVITFFPWPDQPRAAPGAGQVIATACSIPAGSIEYWRERLREHSVETTDVERFDERGLATRDPDGIVIELIATDDAQLDEPWPDGPVPAEHAVGPMRSVTAMVREIEPSRAFLTGVMGLQQISNEKSRYRFTLPKALETGTIDVVVDPDAPRGRMGPGTVHHIAWRVADDETEQRWQETLREAGRNVSDQRERNYFRSIYFREPGGVIFEIATEGPGFTTDEKVEELGSGLRLPPWLESQREEIERALPPLDGGTE